MKKVMMRGMKETFIVVGHRSANSVFGAMDSPCKDAEGEVTTFDTRLGAEAYRDALTKDLTTPNVSYTVESLFE